MEKRPSQFEHRLPSIIRRNRRKIEAVADAIDQLHEEFPTNNVLEHAQHAADFALEDVEKILSDIQHLKGEKNNISKQDAKPLQKTLREIIQGVRLMHSDLKEVVANRVVPADHEVEDKPISDHIQRLSIVEGALSNLDKELTLYIRAGKRVGDQPRER